MTSRHNLRDVLDDLRRDGVLLDVEKTVDPSWEVSAVLDRLEREGHFNPVVFGSVGSHPGWSILGNLFADRDVVARILRLNVNDMTAEVARRLGNPIPPEMADEGASQAYVYTGDDADLDAVPLPTLHERDAAPYISLGVAICRDPDTRLQNVGVYRFMRRGPRELVPSLTSISNAADIFRKYEQRGEPMDIAILPGVSPALALAASYKAPAGTEEISLAGGLAEEPVKLVRGRTVDLDVPADAEVVIEAQVMPGERYPEAPFADMSRAYSREKRGPLVRVTAVTHREDPIFQLAFSGHADASNMAAVCNEVAVWRAVSQATSCVKRVHIPANGYGFHCWLGVEKSPTLEGRERGEQRNAMLAALGAVTQIKLVAAFDNDIDIFDDDAVLGAIARRFQAVDPLTGASRLQVLANVKGATYDPSSFHREYPNSKLMLDVTLPTDLSPEQRSGFDEAACRGAESVNVADYLPRLRPT